MPADPQDPRVESQWCDRKECNATRRERDRYGMALQAACRTLRWAASTLYVGRMTPKDHKELVRRTEDHEADGQWRADG